MHVAVVCFGSALWVYCHVSHDKNFDLSVTVKTVGISSRFRLQHPALLEAEMGSFD